MLACDLHGATKYSKSLKCLPVRKVTFILYESNSSLFSHPWLRQFCMRQLSICTSWQLNMWNVTDYQTHSLVPSAAMHESAVSISFLGEAGWRTEGNIHLHTREPLKLINAFGDQPETSNIHRRPDVPKCNEGHQVVYVGREKIMCVR